MQNSDLIASSANAFLEAIPRVVEAALDSILSKRSTRTLKEDGSYVTEGDLQMQGLLVELLNEKIPEASLISEEMAAIPQATSNGWIVVIDPIDGTENFTSGLAEWGTSISCYHDGMHVASLIGCPELRQWVFTGQTAYPRFKSRIHGLSSSLSKQDILAVQEGFEYRIIGCCVYNMLNVVRGSFHSFENPKGARSWDILGGLNLALERGLIVTVEGKNYAGEYLEPNRKYRFRVENR